MFIELSKSKCLMNLFLCFVLRAFFCLAGDSALSLHDQTVGRFVKQLASSDLYQRTAAAENLGFLRAYSAADALVQMLQDDSVEPRRAAAVSLAWCGGRKQVDALLKALDDSDWSVRQAAWVALTNLTGMEFPYDSHAEEAVREAQAGFWREWWQRAAREEIPAELSVLPHIPQLDLAAGCPVTASTTYKGPAGILTGSSRSGYWQTKNVPFPQHCTVDLGGIQKVGSVVVTQYGKGYCMTDYAVEVSRDGKEFLEVLRRKELSVSDQVISFPQVETRFVRVVSYANEFERYPTTFYQIGIFEMKPSGDSGSSQYLSCEREMRALGALGCSAGSASIAAIIRPFVNRGSTDSEEKWMVQSGIRALGRLAVPETQAVLVELLDNPQWARYAADALGDFGGADSSAALLDAYPDYAIPDRKKPPQKLPLDDKPGFEAVDRMYETPYSIALALSRFTFENQVLHEKLLALTPLLVMNMANDFDGAMLYEEQAFHQVNRYLLEQAGVCGDLCELAFENLGLPSSEHQYALPDEALERLREFAANPPGATSFAATWLTALCRDQKYSSRLIKLLEHENGWVRINAAKTLMFMSEKSAVEPIAALLKASRPEAEYGWFTEFLFKNMKKQGQDEYNAPSPCWREAYTRALGMLGAEPQVPLLIKLLNDERNVLEVQYAAAVSLDKIGAADALAALKNAAADHPFHSVKLKAREALWRRGGQWNHASGQGGQGRVVEADKPASFAPGVFDSLVFIKGSNNMTNDFQIDIWRQNYSTTDSGPTYRPGDNIYMLKPVAPDGKVTPLTAFDGGYVADCEVSWEGAYVLFCRRDKGNPWWHLWELELESGKLTQLTSGPYHDVQPNYLPDGRIVFSSSRTGMRDEYHGYPATGLTVMNRDGSGIHCIGFNLGRDNEPVMMNDGRILFSRLELFYSRLKTEITVQAVRPDGTMNTTLYGPEKRDLWLNVTRQSGEKWPWGMVAPRHRVLRLTQPQPLNNQQVIVATTGGATVVGPGRMNERIIPRWNNMAVTTPFPLDEKRVLCAATTRTFKRDEVDLGLYIMDVESGELKLVYNDPLAADYEARPVMQRVPPRSLPSTIIPDAFTARLMCNSARVTQEVNTRKRGKLVRIIEGQPVTSRHHTHTSAAGEAWKNHVGTQARVLGTVPLGADGSFYVEVPADRLIHCQILDSDRRVVGNQLIWMYARPGETRSCVGCHEMPDTAGVALAPAVPVSASYAPIRCLPAGGEFTYRAKAWHKGTLSDETEERTRTVNAISFPGRM